MAQDADLPLADLSPNLSRLTAPFTSRRRGVETKIIAGPQRSAPDAALIRALRLAHAWAGQLKTGNSMQQIADDAKVTARYVAGLEPLAGLSPRIQSAIVSGHQPVDLTLEALVRRALPLDWIEQERVFGIHR